MRLRTLYATAFILTAGGALVAFQAQQTAPAIVLAYAAASILALVWRGCASRLISQNPQK